jgi:hypothetical protein
MRACPIRYFAGRGSGQVPYPITDGTNDVAVGVGSPRPRQAGKGLDLDPYVKSLKGDSVRIGALSG